MKTFLAKSLIFFSVFFISLYTFAQVQIDSVVVINESCSGNCDGTLTIFTSGGTAPILFDIGGTPQTSNVFIGLCATTYNVTVNDALPSSDFTTATITSPSSLTFTISTVNATAYGVCNGSANVTINGGTPPYTITYYAANGTTILQTGSSTSIAGLCAGTFYVGVSDANSCPSIGPDGPGLTMFTISQPPPPALVVNQSIQMPHCWPNCDGNTQLTVSGGVSPYTYSWGSWDLGGFCDGDNAPAWTVTDDIGQQVSGPAQGMWASQPQINSIIIIDEKCPGVCEGEIQFNIFGGDPPYYFSIDNGVTWQSNPIFSNLCSGTYTLYYNDSYGCGGWTPLTVNPATPIVVSIDTIINTPCIGGCNGSVILNVSGGTPPYSYSWSDSFNQTTPTATNLCAGTYTCTVIDSNGCDTTINITINEPSGDTLTGTWNTTPETCFGTCDGTAMVIPNGGISPYTFQWDDPCSTTTASSACAGCQGVYNCIVTDSNGCSITVTGITVSGPSPLIVTAVFVSNPTSIGACDGVANGNVTGGSSPYDFLWIGCPPTISPNITTPIANGLCDGEYQVIVTDMNGCVDSSDCITIIDPPSSINENTNNINNIYPNPTGGLITIEFSDKILLPLTIEIIDVKGKMVKDYFITDKNSIIDLTSLPKGAYVLSNAKLSIHKTIILK